MKNTDLVKPKRIKLKERPKLEKRFQPLEVKDARISIGFISRNTRTETNMVSIQIDDGTNHNRIIDITIDPVSFVQALSSLAYVKCKASLNFFGIKKLNMKAIYTHVLVKVPFIEKPILEGAAWDNCPEGWKPTLYFGSQSSIQYKNGDIYANCEYIKWIREDENEGEDN